MTQLAELDKCVNRLTREVVDIRGIATKAGIDAADVRAELRDHRRILEALRETQLEQGRDMRKGFFSMNQRFADVEDRFVRVDRDMREGFAVVDQRFTSMEERFTQLEDQVKEGLTTVVVELAKINTFLRVAIRQPGQPVES
jgi:hypothetical protein